MRYNPASLRQATLETQSAAGAQIFLGAFFMVVPLVIVAVILVIASTS